MGRLALVLIPAALLATGQTASADMSITFNSASPAQNLSVTDPGGGTVTGAAGQYNWTWNGGDRPAFIKSNNTFTTFCIEVNQHISYNQTYNYSLVNLDAAPLPGIGQGNGSNNGMGVARADRIRNLFDSSYSSAFDASRASAFQLAIWEIVFETATVGNSTATSFNVSGGNFQLTNSFTDATVATKANDMLALAASYAGPRKYAVYGLSSAGAQDQLVFMALPEPSGVLMALTGLAPLAGVVRYRRRLGAG